MVFRLLRGNMVVYLYLSSKYAQIFSKKSSNCNGLTETQEKRILFPIWAQGARGRNSFIYSFIRRNFPTN